MYRPKGKLTPEARKLMLADLAKVHEYGERREYAEAKNLALKVRGGLAWAGVRSAHLTWVLAVASDCSGTSKMLRLCCMLYAVLKTPTWCMSREKLRHSPISKSSTPNLRWPILKV